jgi:hypothetical protein
MALSPRNPDGTFKARAGTITKGSMTLRGQEYQSQDILAKEFELLRASENPID